MKLPHALLLALIFTASAEAQEVPPAPPSAPSAPQPAPATPSPPPAEVVQPAIPVNPPASAQEPVLTDLPSDKPVSFTPEQVKQIETGLKKQMMLVGMGSGVLGLLLGMMIGRKTAPRPTGRRF
jgi:hypothetical protein